MAVRFETVNGKQVKLYPAFNTEAHAHDIEFRRNRVENEIYATYNPAFNEDGRYQKLSESELKQAEVLKDQLTSILEYLDFPVTYLPWNLYEVARETIGWASCSRRGRR